MERPSLSLGMIQSPTQGTQSLQLSCRGSPQDLPLDWLFATNLPGSQVGTYSLCGSRSHFLSRGPQCPTAGRRTLGHYIGPKITGTYHLLPFTLPCKLKHLRWVLALRPRIAPFQRSLAKTTVASTTRTTDRAPTHPRPYPYPCPYLVQSSTYLSQLVACIHLPTFSLPLVA